MLDHLQQKSRAALLGSLGVVSLVLAGLTVRNLMQPRRGRADGRPGSPAVGATDAETGADTFSVAGEEDPGAAVDAPAPPPSHTP
jgi:hypothetical protein